MKTILFVLSLVSTLALADNPCKAKGEAQRSSRKALEECVKSWATAQDAAPTDDCVAKLGAFTTAAKDRITCIGEHKKK